MADSSPRLELPYLVPAQAQKHVTHNEALARLDALVQLAVTGFDAETPPATPVPGEIHALGPAPTGDWAGQGGRLALREAAGWRFLDPGEGWRAWDITNGGIRVCSGGTWTPLALAETLPRLGINTGADATNRLAVAAAATLLTHEGGSHRLKVNKAAAGDTASLLFQSGWSGHAEMGLAGDTAFAVKVSADGSAWSEALRADPASGTLSLGLPVTGAGVQQSATDVAPGRLALAEHAYGPGNLLGPVALSGGTPTGAVIERGDNGDGAYTRFADGTMICTRAGLGLAATASESCSAGWTFPAPFAAPPDHVALTLSLDPADWSDSSRRAAIAATGALSAPGTGAVTLGFVFSDGPGSVTVANCSALAVGRWA